MKKRLIGIGFVFLVILGGCRARQNNDGALSSLQLADTLGANYVTDAATRKQAADEMTLTSAAALAECNKEQVVFKTTPQFDSVLGEFSILYSSNYEIIKQQKMYTEEFAALSTYSGSLYGSFNYAATGNDNCFSSVSAMTRSAISALNRLPLTKGLVYSAQRFKKGEAKNKLTVGAVQTFKKFMSTSWDIEISKGFLTTDPEMEGVLFYISNPSGKDISKFALLESEREVLFKPGAQWRIDKPLERVDGSPSYFKAYVTDVTPRVEIAENAPTIEEWSKLRTEIKFESGKALLNGILSLQKMNPATFRELTSDAKVENAKDTVNLEWPSEKSSVSCMKETSTCVVKNIGYSLNGVTAFRNRIGKLISAALVSNQETSGRLQCSAQSGVCFAKK